MAERVIIRQGCRILTPAQYRKLSAELTVEYRLICDFLLATGLRLVEFWYVVDHPDCYHAANRLIDLPREGASKKDKSSRKDRTIRLTRGGCNAVEAAFASKLQFKERDAMRGSLIRAAERAGLGRKGIMPKMFRKILVSWLVEVRNDLGVDALEITANMGHDEKTLRDHYLGVGFSKEEHAEMLEYLKGWKE